MSLFRKVEPLPGESLPGMVARAAALNVYPRAYDVLAQAGLSRFYPEAIAMRDAGIAQDLAGVFGVAAEKLVPLFHPAVDDGRSIDFFGVAIRAVHREARLRRVSPRALSISPHVRAVWHLRPLAFDPATKEVLLDHCPVCQQPLGFAITKGVAFCDHCVQEGRFGDLVPAVDLREFPQPLVEVPDLEALDFATGLVDPDPSVRAGFAPALHDDLAAFDRSELFELVLAIGTALMVEDDPDYQPTAESIYRSNTRTIEPQALARAGRALLDWPRSYHALLDAAAHGAAGRSARWGRLKDLGAMGILPKDTFLAQGVKAAIAAQNMAFLQAKPVPRDAVRRGDSRDPELYVGAKQLRIESKVAIELVTALGQHPDIVKYRIAPPPAPVVFIRDQVEPIIRRYKDLIAEEAAAFNIGIPIEAMRDFETAGYVDRVTGFETQFSPAKINYSTAQLEGLFGHYLDIATLGTQSDDIIPFTDAMLLFPAGRRPWFALWEQILQGRIDSCIHREKTKALTDIVCVRRSQIDREALVARMAEFTAPMLDSVTIGNARLSLGIQSYPVFTAAVEGKIFKLNADKTVPYAQVQDFARQFILVNEIGMRSGVGRHKLRGWLEDNGVMPARDLGVKGGALYGREQVESLFG